MKKIKILYINGRSDKIAGAGICLLNLIKRIDHSRFEPIVLLYGRGELANVLEELKIKIIIRELGTIVRNYNPLNLIRFIFYLVSGVCFVCSIIKHNKVDIVHCNQNVCIFYAAIASRLTGVKCIWHVRNRVSNFGIIGSLLYRLTHKIICVSDYIKVPFLKMFPDAVLKVETAYDGITQIEETPEEMLVKFRKEFGILTSNKVVGTVGRITRWKAQDYFLEAVSILVKKYPDLKIMVVGDCVEGTDKEYKESGKFKEELKEIVLKFGLSSNVIFTGFRKDACHIIKLFDVFVLPSIEEPFGMVLLEAMVQGVPIVATNAGGVPEIILDGKEGVLVPPRQPQKMADAIEKIMTNKEAAKNLARNGLIRVRDNFSIKTSVRNIESIYEELLKVKR